MNDLASLLAILLRVFLLWLAALLVVWALLPDAKPIAAGLILGSSISMLNAQLLGAKTQQLAKLAIENKSKKMSLGFLTRACLVLIGTMTAVRFDQFDLVSTIIGFAFFPVFVFMIGIILVRRQ